MITIVDLGIGNLYNLNRAFRHYGHEVNISNSKSEIAKSEKIVLAGVGNFKTAMKSIDQIGIRDFLIDFSKDGNFLLGICLGMQILTEYSEEGGITEGLGIIPGRVTYLRNESNHFSHIKVPNIGWNNITFNNDGDISNSLLSRNNSLDEFYFVHSLCVHTNKENELASSKFGDNNFSSVISQYNVTGCQFHPENSGKPGLSIIKEFIKK